MGKGKIKFQDSWLNKELDSVLIKDWLEAVHDIFFCRMHFVIGNFWNCGISQF